jgi:predicted subunit of tRNA(5-methylaminomethyl-2-thiouridylate) methyltransferase
MNWSALALCLIIVMIYNTIDQMRPEQIIQFIHDKVLEAKTDRPTK